MDRWTDRVAVVTGASEGIGKAIGEKLAGHGMRVAALARRKVLLEEIELSVKESGAKGSLKGYVCDVSSNDDVTATFKRIESDLGPVCVVVNNAGVLNLIDNLNIDVSDFQTMINVNLLGVVHCTNAGLASMKNHNTTDGHIINISSIAGPRAPEMPETAAYFATYNALNALTKGIRNQLKRENSYIKVSLICPGLVKSQMTRTFIEQAKGLSLNYLVPEDVANAVIYSLSALKHCLVSDIIIEPV